VTGLQHPYKSAFGAELIRILENVQGQQKTCKVIRAKIQAFLSRIRSLAALLLPEGLASNTGKQKDDVAAYQAGAEGHQHAGGRMSMQQIPQTMQERSDTPECVITAMRWGTSGATAHDGRNGSAQESRSATLCAATA
jgi:hypothetical protein